MKNPLTLFYGKQTNVVYNGRRNKAVMFEIETLFAFGVGAALVGLAPVVKKLGNEKLGNSMGSAGKSMAKSGIKVGVTVAGVAANTAKTIAKSAAETVESFGDLVAEAKSELVEEPNNDSKDSSNVITTVTVE